jgi:hypothetical protein
VGITARLTSENRLRQERFSPKRDQTARVQILRMQRS